jgi:hypothetical protein
MFEDRAILESVFAKNRNAIMDLHNLEKSRSHTHTSSTSSTAATDAHNSQNPNNESYLPGSHGHNLSNATGVEVPPIPDVLPSKPEKRDKPATDTLSRRFSKRGVRLGVHMSILDLGAHDAATSLRKKWIAQASAHARSGDNGHHHMSTIAEDSTQAEENKDREPSISADDHAAPTNHVCTPPRRGDSGESASKGRSRANSLISSPIGKAVSKVIHRLSLSNVRHGRRGNEPLGGNAPSSEGSSNSTSGDGSDETGAGHSHCGSIKKQFATQKDKLEAHLTKPELSTPDYNQEFENGRW